MTIDADSSDWPYQQVAAELRRRIEGGALRGRMPSIHALADELSVSHMTVQKALGVLKDEGLIHSTPGLGTFVSS